MRPDGLPGANSERFELDGSSTESLQALVQLIANGQAELRHQLKVEAPTLRENRLREAEYGRAFNDRLLATMQRLPVQWEASFREFEHREEARVDEVEGNVNESFEQRARAIEGRLEEQSERVAENHDRTTAILERIHHEV